MPGSFDTSNKKALERTSKAGRAFIIESLVLFIFLVATLIVVAQLFFASVSMSVEGQNLERATVIASNVAERFSADPTSTDLDATEDGLDVTCTVTPEGAGNGMLYKARISVFDDGNCIYSIQTSRYVSEVS